MNRLQRIILIIGLALIGSVTVCVPWDYTFSYQGSHRKKPALRAFILFPPESEEDAPVYGVSLSVKRLAMEWVGISALCGTAFLVAGFKDRQHRGEP